MDDNEFTMLLTKRIIIGCLAATLIGFGTCAYVSHDSSSAQIRIEQEKVDAEKAARDRAMFEGINRAPRERP